MGYDVIDGVRYPQYAHPNWHIDYNYSLKTISDRERAVTTQTDTNTTSIGTNATNIGTNATDIGTNTTNIGTNTTNIGTNTTNIGTNATNIGTNTTDIGINTAAIAALDAGGTSYVIPLVNNGIGAENQWTITEGDNRQVPVVGYSEAEWDIAYDNKIGIEKAINYAVTNGYQTATLPDGHYNICYSNTTADVLTDVLHNEHDITMPSNIQFTTSKEVYISVMFDSDTTATVGTPMRNPHDLGSYLPNELPGNVFSFARCYNSSIKGVHIIGEMAQRSFVDVNEKAREFNNGIFVHRGSAHCFNQYVTTVGFSGDGHSGVSSHNPDFGSQLPDSEVRTFYKGLLNRADGTIDTGVATAYTTALVSLSNIDETKGNEIVMRTNIGFVRIPDFENQNLILAWYDASDVFIQSEDFEFLQIVKIPVGAAKIRMCCQGETAGPASVYKTLRITPPVPHDYKIQNCTIIECHRGGISNMVNETIIENCTIYNNGLGWKEGYPQFPDGTRFGINCEDGLANLITIRNNVIDNSNHGVLMSGLSIHIENNTISNCTGNGVILYYMSSSTVTGNTFTNCGLGVGFIESTLKRDITITNNTMHNCLFSDVSEAAYLNTADTVFTCHGNKVRSPHAIYKAHSDYTHNFIVSDHVHTQTPLLDGASRHEYIRGKYSNTVFHLLEAQVSTNYVYVDTEAGSNLTINCSTSDRRIGNEGTICGLSQNGGKQYRALLAAADRTYNFYGEGHATLNPDLFEFPQTGTPASTTHTLNFYDYTIKMNGGFAQMFNMDTNTANGTTDLYMNFHNCKFVIESGIGGTLFYIDYYGALHNVEINLNYCEIDTTRTAELVYIGDRHASYVNQVQLTKNNTVVKGALDETDPGFNIITV